MGLFVIYSTKTWPKHCYVRPHLAKDQSKTVHWITFTAQHTNIYKVLVEESVLSSGKISPFWPEARDSWWEQDESGPTWSLLHFCLWRKWNWVFSLVLRLQKSVTGSCCSSCPLLLLIKLSLDLTRILSGLSDRRFGWGGAQMTWVASLV